MDSDVHYFSDTSILFFLPVLFIIAIFALVALVYMLKGINSKQSDFFLRMIIINMAVAALIQNTSRILLFIIFSINQWWNKTFCRIMEQIIETTTATVPFLLSSYFITFYNLQVSSSRFKISNVSLQIILFIVNWILPIIYWSIGVWVVKDAFNKYDDACIYEQPTVIFIHKICQLCMSVVGLIFGILIKIHYSKGKMDTETKIYLKIYLAISASYCCLIFINIITDQFDLGKFEPVYGIFHNCVFVILPTIFFVVFCCRRRKKNKSIFSQTTIDFDNASIIECSSESTTEFETEMIENVNTFCTDE